MASFISYDTDETAYAEADNVNSDTVIEQPRFWYDQAGQVIATATRQRLPDDASTTGAVSAANRCATAPVFWYDGLARQTIQYLGYDLDETAYAQAGAVADDTILEQTETHYDAVGNVIHTTNRQRHHNAPASQTGALGDASTDPKARVTYTAHWYDALGRGTATADYGTNGGTALVRPDTVPQRSDTVLVAEYQYDGANRRIQKNVIEAGGGPSAAHYFYNGSWQFLEERFVDGQGAAVASNRYVWSVSDQDS